MFGPYLDLSVCLYGYSLHNTLKWIFVWHYCSFILLLNPVFFPFISAMLLYSYLSGSWHHYFTSGLGPGLCTVFDCASVFIFQSLLRNLHGSLLLSLTWLGFLGDSIYNSYFPKQRCQKKIIYSWSKSCEGRGIYFDLTLNWVGVEEPNFFLLWHKKNLDSE